MKKREINECKPYTAPGHFNMTAIRIHGKEESGANKFWMGMSHFLPGGGAEYDCNDSNTQKIYYVLDGEIVITDSNNEKIILNKSNSLHIGPNEGRSMLNESNLPCTCLVIVNYPA